MPHGTANTAQYCIALQIATLVLCAFHARKLCECTSAADVRDSAVQITGCQPPSCFINVCSKNIEKLCVRTVQYIE